MTSFTGRSRWPLISVMSVTAATFALIGLASAGAADQSAPRDPKEVKGSQSFEYEVISMDYSVNSVMDAHRYIDVSGCVEGRVRDVDGSVTTSPTEVAQLQLGAGRLRIGKRGTTGSIHGGESFSFSYDSSFVLQGRCGPAGTSLESFTTDCPSQMDARVYFNGAIKGGVGDRVRIKWTFDAGEPNSGKWARDTYCGEPISFAKAAKCTSPPIAIERLTRKRVKIPYSCPVPTVSSPPPGTNYDGYNATSTLTGSISMKRTD